jgi:uncharacterized protein YndB with AHSA1/START domain
MQIDLSRTVAAPPRAVFAIVADVPRWPQIFGAVKEVDLLTTGPLRTGTRLRENRILFGHDAVLEAEVVTFDPPHELRLALEHRGMVWERDHVIDAVAGGGSRVMLIFRSRPDGGVGRTMQPLMIPMMQVMLRDELEQDLADIVAAVSARISVG